MLPAGSGAGAALDLRCHNACTPTGELSSDDDWYLLSSGIAVLQTTNAIYNTSAYSLLTPKVPALSLHEGQSVGLMPERCRIVPARHGWRLMLPLLHPGACLSCKAMPRLPADCSVLGAQAHRKLPVPMRRSNITWQRPHPEPSVDCAVLAAHLLSWQRERVADVLSSLLMAPSTAVPP